VLPVKMPIGLGDRIDVQQSIGATFDPKLGCSGVELFAIDAAHGLGEKGEETQVLALDERGSTQPVWTYGIDSYPPGL